MENVNELIALLRNLNPESIVNALTTDNGTGVIDAICAKLGIALDKLIPAVVEFGTYECQLTIRVCIYILLAGILMSIFAFWLTRKGYEIVPLVLFIIGITAIIICVVVLIFAAVDLHKWETYPEMMAYHYILNLLR